MSTDTPEFQNPMVTVELTGLSSYTTLTQTFRQGEPANVSREQWASFQQEVHPNTGHPIFVLSGQKGTTPEPTLTPVPATVGITVVHNTPDGSKNGNTAHERGDRGDTTQPGPNDMSRADLRIAGLDSEVDTGVFVENDDTSGPSGHDGLDEVDDETVEAVKKPSKAPVPKKIVVARPALRKALPDGDIEV